MLICRGRTGDAPAATGDGRPPADVRWFDLCDPAPDELRRVERATGLRLPTEEHIRAIEMSSRTRLDGDVLRLNVPFFAHDLAQPPSPLGLVVAPRCLVSIRYGDAPAFGRAAQSFAAAGTPHDGAAAFTALMQALVAEVADRLETVIAEAGELSTRVLCPQKRSTRQLNGMLGEIGRLESGLTRARQTTAGLSRIVGFAQENPPEWLDKPRLAELRLVHKDLDALGELDGQMTDKLQFLLDAVLGFINIDQNEVIKILTVASVVSIPPMILAGIWGMNFVNMLELKLPWGYPAALALIVLSAALPLLWFKRRGWL